MVGYRFSAKSPTLQRVRLSHHGADRDDNDKPWPEWAKTKRQLHADDVEEEVTPAEMLYPGQPPTRGPQGSVGPARAGILGHDATNLDPSEPASSCPAVAAAASSHAGPARPRHKRLRAAAEDPLTSAEGSFVPDGLPRLPTGSPDGQDERAVGPFELGTDTAVNIVTPSTIARPSSSPSEHAVSPIEPLGTPLVQREDSTIERANSPPFEHAFSPIEPLGTSLVQHGDWPSERAPSSPLEHDILPSIERDDTPVEDSSATTRIGVYYAATSPVYQYSPAEAATTPAEDDYANTPAGNTHGATLDAYRNSPLQYAAASAAEGSVIPSPNYSPATSAGHPDTPGPYPESPVQDAGTPPPQYTPPELSPVREESDARTPDWHAGTPPPPYSAASPENSPAASAEYTDTADLHEAATPIQHAATPPPAYDNTAAVEDVHDASVERSAIASDAVADADEDAPHPFEVAATLIEMAATAIREAAGLPARYYAASPGPSTVASPELSAAAVDDATMQTEHAAAPDDLDAAADGHPAPAQQPASPTQQPAVPTANPPVGSIPAPHGPVQPSAGTLPPIPAHIRQPRVMTVFVPQHNPYYLNDPFATAQTPSAPTGNSMSAPVANLQQSVRPAPYYVDCSTNVRPPVASARNNVAAAPTGQPLVPYGFQGIPGAAQQAAAGSLTAQNGQFNMFPPGMGHPFPPGTVPPPGPPPLRPLPPPPGTVRPLMPPISWEDPDMCYYLATWGIFMHGGSLGVGGTKNCEFLLNKKCRPPGGILLNRDTFAVVCHLVMNRQSTALRWWAGRVLVPSPEFFAERGFRPFNCLAENAGNKWSLAMPMAGRLPCPDFTVGFSANAFTRRQRGQIDREFCRWRNPSFYMAMPWLYLPFLVCEMRPDSYNLNGADRESLHAMAVAARGVVRLFRDAGLEREINTAILSFAVVHNSRQVRIHGCYAVLDGPRTTYYRCVICSFNYNMSDGSAQWIAFRFAMNLYKFWAPAHLERVRRAINRIWRRNRLARLRASL